ncbi:Fasciclin-like arabinogalactan protein 7 [Ancistrocladus abbreviatus]
MEKTVIFMAAIALLVSTSCPVHAQTISSPTPSPAPAPAPAYVNLTELLGVAGPFHTFLNYLESSKIIDTFQNQANNTEEGITLFVPQDGAFASLKKSMLSNLTQDQLKSILLFHALPHYYSLSDFKNLSQMGSIPTLAGGQYTLNFTDISGTIHLTSGWSNTKISSSVLSTAPVALYEINKVLLPEAIFGTDIPPTPAPAPAPEIAPSADSPADLPKSEKSPSSSISPSSSYRMISVSIWSQFSLAILGGVVVMLREGI